MTNEEVDRILSARVPGGSEVRDWFLPHETDRGLENVRNIVRLISSIEREACAKVIDGSSIAMDGRDAIRNAGGSFYKDSPMFYATYALSEAIRARGDK